MAVLGGLIYVLAPKYFVAQQAERDNSTKCKSYRALESIAFAMYRECLGPLKLCQYFLSKGVGKNGTEAVFG